MKIINESCLIKGDILSIDLDELRSVGIDCDFEKYNDTDCAFVLKKTVTNDDNDDIEYTNVKTLLKYLGNNEFEEYYTGSIFYMNLNKKNSKSSFDIKYGSLVSFSNSSFEEMYNKFSDKPIFFNAVDDSSETRHDLYTKEDLEIIRKQALIKSEIKSFIYSKIDDASNELISEMNLYMEYVKQKEIIDKEDENINTFINKKSLLKELKI